MKLTILHTNDVHAQYDAWLRCASLIKKRREEVGRDNCLVLDAGDHFDLGVNECRLSEGNLHLDLLAELEIDAFTPGNNEFYRNPRVALERLTEESKFPWVLSTVSDHHGEPFAGLKSKLIMERGIKVGILGALDPMNQAVEVLHGLTSLDINESIKEGAQELRTLGAEIIILISHLGLRDDVELITNLPGVIDVVIGGHSHSELHEAKQIGSTLIVQAGGLGEYVGELELEIAQGQIKEHRYCLHKTIDFDLEDPSQRQIVDHYRALSRAILDEELFILDKELSHPEITTLLAKIMRSKFQADIGMMFAPGTSGGLKAGPIKVSDIYEICQSFITPASFEISGKQILGLIKERENVAITNAQGFGIGFRPQGQAFGKLALEGLKFVGGPGKPDSILVNSKPLDPNHWYTVGSVSHLYRSETGGYPSLDGCRNINMTRFTYLRDVLLNFFRSPDAANILGNNQPNIN